MKRSGAILLGLCLASAAGAATFTVTNTNDTGPGSFRQAIVDANDNAGADTIAFAIPGADPGCDGTGVCTINVCGDGYVDNDVEQCDHGPDNGLDGTCSAECSWVM